MRVPIGVTTAWSVETWGEEEERPGGIVYTDRDYATALYRSGALPLLLVPPPDLIPLEGLPDLVEALLNRVGGLYFSGGGGNRRFQAPDLPGLEEQQPLRYRFERLLVLEAWRRGMPVMGACRGHQMMAEALGGRIAAETVEGHRQDIRERTAHPVRVIGGTRLAGLINTDRWMVNSLHCQVVEQPPPGFRVAAYSEEGYVEAMEAEGERFWMGFQFHPEMMYDFDPLSRRVFEAFIEAAAAYMARFKVKGKP